jgi:hypothetical protein
VRWRAFCEALLGGHDSVSAAIGCPVSPLAVDAMKEIGIDISGQQVKDVRPSGSFCIRCGLGVNQRRCLPFVRIFR